MSETNPVTRKRRAGGGDQVHHDHRPYWKSAHHDWRVWVGLFFMLTAITIYVMSDDLSFLPHVRRSAASGKR